MSKFIDEIKLNLKPKNFLVNYNLINFNTFRLESIAKYLAIANNYKELVSILKICHRYKKVFVLIGGGSNVIFRNPKINKMVIICKGFQIKKYKTKFGQYLTIFAGTHFSLINSYCLNNSLTGFEWSYGIPASIGGASRMNAGAYGNSISDSLVEVEYFENGRIKKVKNKNCKYGYRTSIFDAKKTILRVKLFLPYGDQDDIRKLMKLHIEDRNRKQPLPLPNSGSIFKNPVIHTAGWYIEHSGLKGTRIGGAEISNIHANFFVNIGNATYDDFHRLLNLCKSTVYSRFRIKLKEEIVIV